MSIFKQYITNVSSQAVGRIFSAGANFIVFVLVARLLGTEVFGKYSYIITFIGLSIAIAELGTTSILSKDIAQIYKSAETYWGNFLILRLCLSLLVIIPSIIIAYNIRRDLFLHILFCSLSLPFLTSHFFEPVFQVFRRPWFSMHSSVISGLFYMLSSVVILIFSKSLLLVVIAYIGANIIYAVVAFSLSQTLLKPKFKVELAIMKNILKLSAPLAVSSIFTLVNSRADIFMLSYMRTDNDVGIYNAAYRFLDVAGILAIVFMNPIIPIFSNKAVNDRKSLKEIYMKVIELLAIATIPVAILMPYFSPLLVRMIYGKAFLLSADVLNILVWVGVLFFFCLMSSAVNLSIGVVNQAYWNAAFAASVNILLNYFWIPKYNFIGSAWATLISEVILLGVSKYYSIKNLGNVFCGSIWTKIIGANIILFLLSKYCLFDLNNFLKVCISLSIYLLLIVLLKLIDIGNIASLFNRASKV